MENTNHHVFITGKAGTGKSTLLDLFRGSTRKEVAVLAPTGVAALNVQGQTIHSFFGFKPDVTPDKVRRVSGPTGTSTASSTPSSSTRSPWSGPISSIASRNSSGSTDPTENMVRRHADDLHRRPLPASAGRYARRRGRFSRRRYETPYFFSAQVFGEPTFDMEFLELEKVYRQTDRIHRPPQRHPEQLIHRRGYRAAQQRFDPFVPPDDDFYITLTSTNDLATTRNWRSSPLFRGPCGSMVRVTGAFDRSSLPAEETLKLKTGAQVMLVNNDKEGRWVNGTIGRSQAQKEQGEDDMVVVDAPGRRPRRGVALYLGDLRIPVRQGHKRISTRKTGAFTQYPLRLAWAVTIHKSQGKTFDRVVIDIGRGAFAHGQVYVALSRCTSFAGIALTKRSPRPISAWTGGCRFPHPFQYRKADERMGIDEKRRIIEDAMRRGLNLEILYLKPDDTKSRRVDTAHLHRGDGIQGKGLRRTPGLLLSPQGRHLQYRPDTGDSLRHRKNMRLTGPHTHRGC